MSWQFMREGDGEGDGARDVHPHTQMCTVEEAVVLLWGAESVRRPALDVKEQGEPAYSLQTKRVTLSPPETPIN